MSRPAALSGAAPWTGLKASRPLHAGHLCFAELLLYVPSGLAVVPLALAIVEAQRAGKAVIAGRSAIRADGSPLDAESLPGVLYSRQGEDNPHSGRRRRGA